MRLLSFVLFTCLVLSCSPKSNNDKPQGVLTETQKKTLENSKKTDDVLEQADKERREKVGED